MDAIDVNENLLTFLVTQGGFAVLAWYMIRQFAALQQAQQALLNRVIEVMSAGATSEANLAEKLAGRLDKLNDNITGLRRIGHDTLSWFAYFEHRLHELETWRAKVDGSTAPPAPRPPRREREGREDRDGKS